MSERAVSVRRPSAPERESGFTLVETMMVVAMLLPILGGIAITSSTVNDTLGSDNRAADVITSARRFGSRIAELVRPAKLGSVRLPADTTDVAAGRAAAVADWIDPPSLEWRTGLQFAVTRGLGIHATTGVREIRFARDRAEAANGIDDDGDGFIDEGEVSIQQAGVSIAVLRDVEDCRFRLDGRILELRLRIARRDQRGRSYRAVVEHQFHLRNN